MNNEPDYNNLYFERTNKMDININTNDLLKNEELKQDEQTKKD